jgi:hypothetical protein
MSWSILSLHISLDMAEANPQIVPVDESRPETEPVARAITPTFISGYNDGVPIRSRIRVMPQNEVDRIEKEIEEEDERRTRNRNHNGVVNFLS